MSYNYDTEINDEPDWDALEQRADEEYDIMRDACAHFPKEIWDEVRHMPTAQALMVGEELVEIYKNTVLNKGIADSIWGEERVA